MRVMKYCLAVVCLVAIFAAEGQADAPESGPVQAYIDKQWFKLPADSQEEALWRWMRRGDYLKDLAEAITSELCGHAPVSPVTAGLARRLKTARLPSPHLGIIGQRMLDDPSCNYPDKELPVFLQRMGLLDALASWSFQDLDILQQVMERGLASGFFDQTDKLIYQYLVTHGEPSVAEWFAMAKALADGRLWFDDTGKISTSPPPEGVRTYGPSHIGASEIITDILRNGDMRAIQIQENENIKLEHFISTKTMAEFFEYLSRDTFREGYAMELPRRDDTRAEDPNLTVDVKLGVRMQEGDRFAYAYILCLDLSAPLHHSDEDYAGMVLGAEAIGIKIHPEYLHYLKDTIPVDTWAEARKYFDEGQRVMPLLPRRSPVRGCDSRIIDLNALEP